MLKSITIRALAVLWAGAVSLHGSTAVSAAYSRPVVAVVGLPGPSPRQVVLNDLFSSRLGNVIASTGVLSAVNPVQLRRELENSGCVEEPCLLRFARAASIDLVILITVEERPGRSLVELTCYGPGFPHNGKIILRHAVVVPTGDDESPLRETAYMIEEESGFFLAGVLRRYRHPVPLKRDGGGRVYAPEGPALNGDFEVWRLMPAGGKNAELFQRLGTVRFSNGGAESPLIKDGDVALYRFGDRARFLDEFYYGRKKEMVYAPPSWQDTFFTVLFTVPASATMPLMAPLGYYGYGDYKGLLLWAVNTAPYLYLEADGLLNRPDTMKENRETISRSASARYYFGLYMAAAGGLPLFVDAFSHEYLSRGARYRGTQPLMGNTATAAYLSMVSGGAGHFYRGSRFWGYLYFHLNNIMVYHTIREFCPEQRYDGTAGRYVKGSIDRPRAHAMLGALGALKIVEVVHVVLSRDRVRTGSFTPGGSLLEPVFLGDGETGLIPGLAGVFRW